jgi:hypothetical protein
MERRDYRKDPDGKPVWLSSASRMYTSWYNFVEDGFEIITGLHRQTAYSAIKLAHSSTLSSLPVEDLLNFKRLANALTLVSIERKGSKITPELLVSAQEMPISRFRLVAERCQNSVEQQHERSILKQITNFMRAAATQKPKVLNDFWTILQDASTKAGKDSSQALDDIITAYMSMPHLQIRRAQAS